ncbi:uncharacterized protein J5F26_013542 isoform 2-T2 [Ciconia maguari]
MHQGNHEEVIAWALTKGKDFNFVFKRFSILVCQGRRVVMRFFEDLLQDVDKTRILASTFFQAGNITAQIPMAGSDSSSSHPSPGSHWTSESVDTQVFQRAYEKWLQVQQKVNEDIADMQETNKSLSQELSKAERKASRLEKEVEPLKKALWEKTLALDMAERELCHARRQAKDRHALHLEKDQERKDAIKKAEGLQEQLAQLRSENLLLHQQLGYVQNKTTQEQMRTVGQLQGELADAFRKQWVTETSLKASTRQCDYLKQENSRLQEDLDKAKAKVRELSAQLELESEKSLQLEARNQELRGLVALLPHCLVTPGVGHTTTALHGKQCEQQARQEMSEKEYLSRHLQTQAATQARTEEINTTDASWREQLEQRIRALESDLERARSTQEESALQPACAQAETKSSEKRNLVDPEMRRCLTEKLKKPNERLAEASAKSPQEQRHRLFSRKAKNLSQSRGQSGNPSGSEIATIWDSVSECTRQELLLNNTVRLMGMGTVYIREEDFCDGNRASFKVQRPMFHLDKPVEVGNKLRYETRSQPDELEVAELIYTEAALRLSIPKKKVLKCVEATVRVIAWALTEGKDFDFVFKSFGILVCRGRRVVMRFFEDLLQDVDKTGILKSSLRPLVTARKETAVFHMPPGGIFVFPQFEYKNEMSEKELAEKAARQAHPGKRLLSRERLSPVRTSGLGLTGEKRRKVGTAAGTISVLPPVEGSRAEKRKEVKATDCPEVRLPPLDMDSQMGAAVAKRPSEIPQVHWPDLSLRFPCPKSTRQERAKVQAGREKAISWGKRDGEEMSHCHPRVEKGKTLAPRLETPQPDLWPPQARQVLTNLEPYRSRQEEWRRSVWLNRLWATAPKQFLCAGKKMELNNTRGKQASVAARGMCAQYGQLPPHRPAPQH